MHFVAQKKKSDISIKERESCFPLNLTDGPTDRRTLDIE